MIEKNTIKFPNNFLWGAAIAAHQTEGDNINNWSVWEKANANKLAANSYQNFSDISPVWKEIKDEAANPSNYISGKACDHYNRYSEDFSLAKKLNIQAIRTSIEWSRIEPEKGRFDYKELDHYKKVFADLASKQIKPIVTLWHWTFPLWIEERGGWLNRKTVGYFCRFVEKVVSYFPEIDFWVTLNEAEIFARESYLLGRWPPGKKNPLRYFMIVNTLILANNKAFKIIKKINPNATVGFSQNITFFEANKNRFLNRLVAKILSFFANEYFLNRTIRCADYIGLNFYFHTTINLFNEPKIVCVKSDMGWDLCEYGIFNVLINIGRYKKPVYITENGLADKNDTYREAFIKDTLFYIKKAMDKGIDVKGYIYWSLIDNFEWDKGFWPRFGLIEIDYKNKLERKIRKSAIAFSEIIANNGYTITSG